MKKLLILAVAVLAVFAISGCATRAMVVVPASPSASVIEYVDADGVVWLVEYDRPQGWMFANIYVGGVFYPIYWTTDFIFFHNHRHHYHGHGYANHSGRYDHSGHRGYRHHNGGPGGGHRNPGHPGYQKNHSNDPNREGHPGNYRKPSTSTKSRSSRSEGIKNAPRKSGGGGGKKGNN